MNRPCLACQRDTDQQKQPYYSYKDVWAWWCSVCGRATAVFAYKEMAEVSKPYKED